MKTNAKTASVTWVHIGGLHITEMGEANYQGYLFTIEWSRPRC